LKCSRVVWLLEFFLKQLLDVVYAGHPQCACTMNVVSHGSSSIASLLSNLLPLSSLTHAHLPHFFETLGGLKFSSVVPL